MQKTPEEIALTKLRTKLTKRFHKACADYGLIADGDHILIGLSGGKDSLALVEFLGKRAQVYVPRFQVTAVHVRVKERDYHSDLSYLQDFCARVRVPLVIRDTEIGENTNEQQGEETKTKEKDPCFLCSWYRRKALFDIAKELSCNKIALGHHLDDLIETLIMNLVFQGSISTIPPLLQMDKMPIQMIRPLCLIEEKDIATYAEMRGYEKQLKLCPLEKVSSRAKVKTLLSQLETLNPNVRDSIWGAMENIKAEYLPQKVYPLSTKQ
ncbi:MAG: tRNA 2-thiocytidine(32) synthetase TtcA [Paludibacteraceae bacterium]|nr:tRNA 2-thiocytidine(32) synthetase TtcA [Paludibacteraceae bacterium]